MPDHKVKLCWNPKKTIDRENVVKTINSMDLINDSHNDEFRYPCSCGDGFKLPIEKEFQEIAVCPSCALTINVRYTHKSINDDSISKDSSLTDSSGDEESDNEKKQLED